MIAMGSGSPVEDPVAVSVAAYSEHADEYEATHAPKMVDRAERFAAALPVGSLILDAGCGPGRDLARFVSHGHIARGVDLNPVFVARANALAPTLLADLRQLQQLFSEDLFDGIWASASLVHLTAEDAANVLRQFAALLRPGGKLYVCVNTVGQTGWLDEPDGRRWYRIWEDDAFARIVSEAGFHIDEIDRGPFVEVWATSAKG
jgi:SAM-dependent methyltransferase